MADTQDEREYKFEASDGAALPAADDLVPPGGRVEHLELHLHSVYFDTADRDLLRHGITLRCRTGDADSGWQLKVPTDAGGSGGARSGDGPASRTEIRLDGEVRSTSVPRELAGLVTGVRRGAPLRHVVTIRTRRTVTRLLAADGRTVVEIADDTVAVAAPGGGRGTLTDWREVEVEQGPAGDADLLGAVADRIAAAGFTRSAAANKVARAIGAAPSATPAALPRKPTAGQVVRAYLAAQDTALVEGDLQLRRGLGGIHPTRVATRRARSTLRIFADLFDADRASAFDAELKWWAELLGNVRDREVQRERFARDVHALPAELVLGPVAVTIESDLLAEQLRHTKALERAMRSRRYLALLRESARWAAEPPFTAAADRPARSLRRDVRTAFGKVDRHLRRGLASGVDDELHRARKAAKRARYAAELVEPVGGVKKATRSVKRYRELQDILGEHQDGVVAADILRRLGAATAGRPGENGWTYGVLYAGELQRAQQSRDLAARWADRQSG
ncbi:CYTH and CHAD domain-containing protein [Nakamurella endophytica]|uniref:CHAD domain-containing protein n=1 Tax=Nakamurella endophytica TaxID=1748367 RepID=A0A917T734_9ACTN|nr:CYTH and CHAD domain-containing protein [Nakamurella endophytica]GGM11825.1 CHAD domain-containing protein [Nakamurella endophytica]